MTLEWGKPQVDSSPVDAPEKASDALATQIDALKDQLNLSQNVMEEVQAELDGLKQEINWAETETPDSDKKTDKGAEKDFLNADGTVDLAKVDAFLTTIKDQEWSGLKAEKRDRSWITAVQIKLASLGYALGAKKIDGWFGKDTKAAVRKFQENNGLAVDGFPGKDTIAKLLDKGAKTASDTAQTDSVSEKGKSAEKVPEETITTIWDVVHKNILINSIDELPKDEKGEYTWATSPKKLYSLNVNGANYQFYDNGRCYNVKLKQTFDSKTIVGQIKKNKADSPQQAEVEHYEGDLSQDDAETIKSMIDDMQEKKVKIYGKEYPLRISVSTSKDSLQFAAGDAFFSMSLKELLDKAGNLNSDRWNKQLLPKIELGLKENMVAKKVAATLRWRKYTMADLSLENETNAPLRTKIRNYFSRFVNKELLIDRGLVYTKADGGKIQIRLDNIWKDLDYHQSTHNRDLILDAKEIANDKWELDEGKFKERLKAIVENIIKKYY